MAQKRSESETSSTQEQLQHAQVLTVVAGYPVLAQTALWQCSTTWVAHSHTAASSMRYNVVSLTCCTAGSQAAIISSKHLSLEQVTKLAEKKRTYK